MAESIELVMIMILLLIFNLLCQSQSDRGGAAIQHLIVVRFNKIVRATSVIQYTVVRFNCNTRVEGIQICFYVTQFAAS